MAAVKHASGLKLLLKLGNGATPEVFSTVCSIRATKGVNFEGEENTFNIGDCDEPEAITWLIGEVVGKRITFDGGGVLHTPDLDKFYEWWDGGETKNCKIVLDVPGADGGIVLTGGFKLPAFNVTGNDGDKVQFSASIKSDGPVVKTANT